jgi:hypothetical protein
LPASAARRTTLVEGDLLDVDLPAAGSFTLAFIALNTLFLVATRERQRAAIRVLASNLDRGGLAVVDVWLPDTEDLARLDGRLIFEYERVDPETGRHVTKTAAARHDGTTGVVDLVAIYEEGDPGTAPARWIRRDVLRLVAPDDLRTMAEDAGLEVEELAGSYDLDPIRPGSERAILLARKP